MVQYLTGEDVIIADWLLLVCAYALVSVRLWFRLIHQKRPLTVSDMFLLFATALVLVVMILFQKEHELGAMRKHAEPNKTVKEFAFSTVLLYHTVVYCTKFSILAFYAKLFPTTARVLRTLCFVTIGYTIACYICAMLLAIFWCGLRVSRNFEIGPDACTVWNYTLFKVNFAMNISSDIFIFLLPFPLLSTLNLARRQVIALCVTFGLGLITMVVSICRCMALLKNAFVPLYVWSMAEMCTAIMVSSLPSLRPLLHKSRRFMVSSSPSGTNEKRASKGTCKKSRSSANTPPTKGSGRQKDNPHARHGSDDTASDIELIHVESKGDSQVEHRELPGQEPIRTDQSVDIFDPTRPNTRRPGDWV